MSVGLNQKNKQRVWNLWHLLEAAPDDRVDRICREYMTTDIQWNGHDPVNQLRGIDAFAIDFWLPLRKSFPNCTRRIHMLFGGRSNGRIDGTQDGQMWVCGTGVFSGTFESDYLTIPATRRRVNIRWGEFCRLEDGKVVEVFFLVDLIDLMQQAGFNVLPPSRGANGKYPPPRAGDGIMMDVQNEQESQQSLDHIREFIFEGLNSYDQSNLESMGLARFFHPDVRWYGPGGIGACLSFREFEENHQKRWLHAFPDREVQDLDALIAEGCYSGAPGWAGVKATHTGEYLDCPVTGNQLDVNGLDYWKREGDQYVENWVFVDMIHLFRQLGIDLFERMKEQIAA